MLDFRKAIHEDFVSIAAMPRDQEELFYMYPKGVFPVTPVQLEEAAATRFSPTVITYGGVVAGYCNFYEANRGQDCWLGNVIVHPEYRRHGVGSFLIETMKEIAQTEYQAQELKLICHNTNTKAMLFYDRKGFKPFEMKVMQHYNGDSIVGVMMKIGLN